MRPQRGWHNRFTFLCHTFCVRATAHVISVGLHPRLCMPSFQDWFFAANQMNLNWNWIKRCKDDASMWTPKVGQKTFGNIKSQTSRIQQTYINSNIFFDSVWNFLTSAIFISHQLNYYYNYYTTFSAYCIKKRTFAVKKLRQVYHNYSSPAKAFCKRDCLSSSQSASCFV